MEKSLKMYDLQEILKAIGMPDGYKAENIQIVNGKICYELVAEKKSIKEIVDEWKLSAKTDTFYLCEDGCIQTSWEGTILSEKLNKTNLPTQEKCEQILAIEQLIMNCWIVNGCKELNIEETKAAIFKKIYSDEITVEECSKEFKKILNFTSLETAQEFYETYKYLIETAKPLL